MDKEQIFNQWRKEYPDPQTDAFLQDLRERGDHSRIPYKNRKTQERRERARKRAAAMKELYERGETLVKIGRKYDITRERVRQILARFYPDMDMRAGGSPPVTNTVVCGWCKTEFIGVPSRRYCSRECAKNGRTKYRTPEDILERSRQYARKNYHTKIKNNPVAYAKQLERNRAYYHRQQELAAQARAAEKARQAAAVEPLPRNPGEGGAGSVA